MRIIRKRIFELSSKEVKEIAFFLHRNFCTIFHEPIFNRIIQEVFDTKFSYSLVYNKGGRLLALCPLHSTKSGLLTTTYSNPTKYEVPYGGWVYDRTEVSFSELLKQIRLSFNEALIYWSIPQLRNNLCSLAEHKKQFQTAIIDLGNSENVIWLNSINSKRRNMIRKAIKESIVIEEVDCTRFEDFYTSMKETYKNASLEIKPKEYYTKILKAYIPDSKATVLLAKKCNAVISGLILLRNRYICHYWLGTTEKGVENLGQGELLQWEAIKWARENGSQYYDLCVVESERLPNIARFKLGFSKKIVPFYCISKRNLGYRIISRIQRCF